MLIIEILTIQKPNKVEMELRLKNDHNQRNHLIELSLQPGFPIKSNL